MERRFFNPTQPQTLQIAVILLYMNAILALLFQLGTTFGWISVIGAGAAYGIANEKRWGWYLGLCVAIIPFALTVLSVLLGGLTFDIIASLLFQGALVVVLLHTMTRQYMRIWFK